MLLETPLKMEHVPEVHCAAHIPVCAYQGSVVASHWANVVPLFMALVSTATNIVMCCLYMQAWHATGVFSLLHANPYHGL